MAKVLMTVGGVACVAIAIAFYVTPTHPDPVQRGEYLLKALACASCHTAILGKDNQTLAGHPEGEPYPLWSPDLQARHIAMVVGTSRTAFAGPWGVSFAANLTPDLETGLGTWTEAMFVRALRTGKHRGEPQGRKLYPPMAIGPMMHGAPVASDADMKALWAYLRQLPPVRNRVPAPIPLPEGRS